MNHLEFIKYHNRHISFTYKGKTKTGVVLNLIPYNKKKNGTDYVFIPTKYLKDWKIASKVKRKNLQQVIDIRYISSARFYNQQNEPTRTV